MLSLKIENSRVEEIFLEGFGSDKESFFQFIIDAYELLAIYSKTERETISDEEIKKILKKNNLI